MPTLAYERREITASWFYKERNRVMWRAIQLALSNDHDPHRFNIRVLDELGSHGWTEKIDKDPTKVGSWIKSIREAEISPSTVWDILVEKLQTLWMRRHAYSVLVGAAEQCRQGHGDVTSVLDETGQSLASISTSVVREDASLAGMAKAIYEWCLRENDAEDSITESWPINVSPVDALGVRATPGRFTILAARPKQGKSRLGIRMAFELALQGIAVDFWSQEMSKADVANCFAACAADHFSWRLDELRDSQTRRNDRFQTITKVYTLLSDIDVHIHSGAAHVRDILLGTTARRARLGDKPYAVFVDYIQVFDGDGKNEHERVADVSKRLAGMSRTFNVWVCGLAQFNRSAAEGFPKSHQLRGSGQLEQDANELLILHRPAAEKGNASEIEQRTGQLQLALNRHGDPAESSIYVDLARLRFTRTHWGFA
jgi:replicative DNA helicase